MALRLRKKKDGRPDWRDYAPSRWERMKLRWSYNWKHRHDVHHGPGIIQGITWLLFIASIAAGVMAVYNLYTDEGWVLLGAILAVFVAPTIMWLFHFSDDLSEMGFFLTIPAIILWVIMFLVANTDSSLWLLIMSIVSFLTLICVNYQLR